MTNDLDRRALMSRMVAGLAAARFTGQPADAAAQAAPPPAAPPPPIPSNDLVSLTPRTELEGRTLAFDFPSLRIGAAEYREGPTGCTVFHFPTGARCAVDVRGGSPGTLMASDGPLDALCFTGGSLYGLEAAAGVSAELLAQRSFATSWDRIAIVRAAVIFDYRVRSNAIYPDKPLGRAALKAARPGVFPLGRHGAGCSATVGKVWPGKGLHEASGQGGAFRQVGPVKVAVFTVVNAVGCIVDRQGRVVRGMLDRRSGSRRSAPEILEGELANPGSPAPAPGNTTLTAVVTNQKLDPALLTPLARQVHSSMARAIQPLHAWNDGDVLFAVTTNEVEGATLNATTLGILASELAWDAVLNCYQDA